MLLVYSAQQSKHYFIYSHLELNNEITNEKEMGNRKLAYPIKKELNGYYYVMNVVANNDAIAEFDRKARISENVIRHLIIRLDEE